MKRINLSRVAVLLCVLGAASCARQVAVESEPAPSMLDVVGEYEYVVDFQGQLIRGDVVVRREGDGYAASMTSDAGAVDVESVERDGNTLTFQLETPGGPATTEATWQSRDRFEGLVYMDGNAFDIEGTRKQ